MDGLEGGGGLNRAGRPRSECGATESKGKWEGREEGKSRAAQRMRMRTSRAAQSRGRRCGEEEEEE